MQVLLQVLTLLGAMAMFLYGMTLMSEGLQKAAGNKLRSFLYSMTSHPVLGIITGIIITFLIQSSSGTTVMVVSMVNSGILSLANAIGVIMGANIGTTFTAWIMAVFGFGFSIKSFAIPFLALGFAFTLAKKDNLKNIGEFIIGFSLLIIGLDTMAKSVPDLNQHQGALIFLKDLTGYGFWSVLIFMAVGAILTAILQASSAAMALTMVFVTKGWINFEMASAMVLGANIGTTITANIAASVANYTAKRTAVAHTIFNVIGVILAIIFFYPLMSLMTLFVEAINLPDPIMAFKDPTQVVAGNLSAELQRSVLFATCFLHTVFNLVNTGILVFFIPQLVNIVNKIIKTPKGEEEVYRLKFIHGGPLSTAELSLDSAKQEIIHLGRICYNGFGYVKEAINADTKDKFDTLNEKLVKYEGITDSVEYEIASYLKEVSKEEISADSSNRIRRMYKVIGEMESLGDSGEAIGRMISRAYAHNHSLNEDMIKKLNHLLDLLDVAYKEMLVNLQSPNYLLKDISNYIFAESNINEYRNTLREEHIVNIDENEQYDYKTGVFYMDIVAELEKMGDFIINISEAQLPNKDD